MPTIDLVVKTPVSSSIRARQVQAGFDVPERKEESIAWRFGMPLEERPWTVGLIVGPSGSGKSTVMRHLWGEPRKLEWKAPSVIDDFSADLSVEAITDACGAVGFNTIPAWLRPFGVLSNGEQFRVELARRLLEGAAPVVVDEFTSLVDRQVAKVASHAAQRFARRLGKQLVAVTCHYDVEEWLQPDWLLDMATREFRWRVLRRRPPLTVEIRRVPWDTWRVFAPFHYLTAHMHRNARCFAAFIDGKPVSFVSTMHMPHPTAHDIIRVSRAVTLPDWQGLGLHSILVERLGAAYKALGRRLRHYPAHRALIHTLAKGPWKMVKRAGSFSTMGGGGNGVPADAFGGRPCAVFEYVGAAWGDTLEASALLLGASD